MNKLLILAGMLFTTSVFAGQKEIIPNCVGLKGERYHAFCDKETRSMFDIDYLYIAKTEVSNLQYKEFLNSLKKTDMEAYYKALPDTARWNDGALGKYMEPMAKHYFSHPAYSNYPLVNVSREQADAYCDWLENQLNQSFDDDIIERVNVRLPSQEEWEVAAKSGKNDYHFIYPWGTNDLRIISKKKKLSHGQANYKNTKERGFGPGSLLSDAADFTAPIYSYGASELGLYNVSGNVAEMVNDKAIVKGGSWIDAGYDLRIDQSKPYKGAQPTVGFRYVVEVEKVNYAHFYKKDKSLDPKNQELNHRYFWSKITFVPTGTLHKNVASSDKIEKGIVEKGESIDMSLFMMYQSEVTNYDYQVFLNDLSDLERKKHIPQSDNWSKENAYAWFKDYATNPMYAKFPVVNISYESALAYCNWVTEKYNGLSDKKIQKVKVRLPSKDEWEYAARGGKKLSPYPWGGPYARNAKGCYLANMNPIDETYVSYSDDGKMHYNCPEGKERSNAVADGIQYLCPVTSYWANDFGLFNMSGNAAEMTAEKGISKGGSWADRAGMLIVSQEGKYSGTSTQLGFRPVFEIIERIPGKKIVN